MLGPICTHQAKAKIIKKNEGKFSLLLGVGKNILQRDICNSVF